MMDVDVESDTSEYKVYKEKPYLNSDREPFGLTIKGKSKEYIHAHEGVKNMMKKGKQYTIDDGTVKVLDVTNNKSMLNAIIEISPNGGNKGNVEIKIYNPSLNKKKGATLELRKMSGFEYSHVESLKNFITSVLDGLIAGNDIEQVISSKKDSKKLFSRITSNPKLFTCDVCNWQTKFGSALKAHKTRIHNQNDNNSCDICDLKGKSLLDIKEHVKNGHNQSKKRYKEIFTCEIPACNSNFESENKLKIHENHQHDTANKNVEKKDESPTSSPPRKKQDIEDATVDDIEMNDLEIEVSDENPDQKWMHVKNANKKRNNSKKDTCNENKNEEKLLEETEDNNAASKDLEDELTLVGSKNDGFRRTGPQDKPECADKKDKVYKCSECLFEFLSDGLLEAHKKTHKMNKSCEICFKFFNDIKSIEEHMKTEHIEKHTTSEWNCDDCAFQANCASELIKHLKVTGHQPSKDISDKRKVCNDYKQCFTCKMDFDGYFNLMNHRKVVHPSNKRCRNFLSGACKFEDECWYVHDKEDLSQNVFENFKCDQCETDFKGRLNFMRHKKTSHSQSIPSCEKFNLNKCYRSDQECWFEHKTNKSKNDANPWPKLITNQTSQPKNDGSKTPDFCEPAGHGFPPDQLKSMMGLISKLCNKVEKMEERFKDLMN